MKRWIVAFVLLVVLFAILLLVRRQIEVERSAVETVVEKAVGKQETRIDLTVILTELSNLSRLETAQMKIVHMSRLEQSYGIIPDMLAGDELTLMAVGEVIGGVDLTKLGADDIFRDEDDVGREAIPRECRAQLLGVLASPQRKRAGMVALVVGEVRHVLCTQGVGLARAGRSIQNDVFRR